MVIVCKGAWHARAPRVVTSTKYMRQISIHIGIVTNGCIVIKIPIVKHNRLFFFNYLGSEIKDSFSGLEFFKII